MTKCTNLIKTNAYLCVLFLCIFFFLNITINFSQLLNVTHFDENNGFNGLKTYNITEDSKKNIWLCTELGVYKFDGYTFTEIISTKTIGYEVFDLFCDSDDNIWLGSFSPFLSCIDSNGQITIVDSKQNGAFRFLESYDQTTLFYYNDSRELSYFKKKSKKTGIIHKEIYLDSTILLNSIKHLKIDSTNPIKLYNKLIKHTTKNKKHCNIKIEESIAKRYLSKEITTVLYNSKYRSIRSNTDFMTFLGDSHKIYDNKYIRDYFLEEIINKLNIHPNNFGSIYLDSEKNIWVTTLNKGLYHIKNSYKNNYTIGEANTEFFKISEINSNIYVSQENKLNLLDLNTRRTNLIYSQYHSIKNFIEVNNVILSISNDGFIHDGYNTKTNKLQKIHLDKKIKNWHIENIKLINNSVVCLFEKEKVLLTKYQNDSLVVINQIDIKRSTDLIDFGEDYIITSVNNTFKVNKKTLIKIPFKSLAQINSTSILNTKKNSILIGTYGNGIYEIDKNLNSTKHIKNINTNSVKNIKTDGNQIYLNTNLGILVVDPEDYNIIYSFSNKNNLPTNNINDFIIRDSSILCLSNYGVTVIKNHLPTKINDWNITNLNTKKDTSSLEDIFSYNTNNISFKINIKSLTHLNKAIVNYRLAGYNNNWEETTNPVITFKNLRPGSYNLLVKILSPDKNYTTIQKEYRFVVSPPFWETNTFYILLLIIVLALSYLTYKFNLNKSLRKEKLQKLNYQLNLQAIQAQINPHFFSNVLTGIQNLILKEDLDTANEYIYNLGSLSRDIIASSKEDLWSLNNEVKLIKNYLDFEKIRFKDRFNYSINIDKDINPTSTLVPSMIIQPLAENAIKHAFKAGEVGILDINFNLKEDNISIEVSDNGTGFKNKENSTSYGLKIIKGKLNLIKNIYKKEVSFEIIQNNLGGTSFIITLPKTLKNEN